MKLADDSSWVAKHPAAPAWAAKEKERAEIINSDEFSWCFSILIILGSRTEVKGYNGSSTT
jgi:hypothetical protein